MWHLGLWWFSPLLAHLTFVHSFHRVFTEPQNSLALCWVPGTQELSRPPLFTDKGAMAMGAPAALNPELNGVFREDFLEGVASELRPDVPAGVNQVHEERRKAFQAEGKACAKKAGTTSVALGKLPSSAQLGGAEECSFFLTLQPPVT